MSVESVLLITDIDGQKPKKDDANNLPTRGERGLKLCQGYQHLPVNEIAPDSPNPRSPDARQSKTGPMP
jgi:hypothetical protein